MNHLDIIQSLYNHNYKAYIVGGSVRDLFLGIDSHDIDITTNANPNQIEEIFKNQKIKTVGKSFGVVLVDGYEVATFRNDNYSGLDHKNCEVAYVPKIEEDLARRDFTINAIAMCELSGKIVDPFNGISDIYNKIIKFVGNPFDRILEDPNRIIRACRFLAKIDGEFDIETFRALRKHSHFVQAVKPERIRLEILKALDSKNTSVFFEALHNIGCLKYIFPSLVSTCNHIGGKYHRESIWDHCMVVGDSISTKHKLIKLAGYLHDVGKPFVYDGESFIDHEKVGSHFIEDELKYLKFSNDEITFITGLITNHMRSISDFSYKSARKTIKNLSPYNCSYEDFLRLKIADRQGNIFRETYTIGLLKDTINKFRDNREVPLTAHDLAISGSEIIELLQIKPGPIVGKIQKELLTFVIETGINEKEALIAEIEKILERQYVKNPQKVKDTKENPSS